MDWYSLKQVLHHMGRFTLTSRAVGVGGDDGEEKVDDGASPCLSSSLSLSTSLPPSASLPETVVTTLSDRFDTSRRFFLEWSQRMWAVESGR